jgi:hypothetical protein
MEAFGTFIVITCVDIWVRISYEQCCVSVVRTDISWELTASIIRVTGIGELGTALAVN